MTKRKVEPAELKVTVTLEVRGKKFEGYYSVHKMAVCVDDREMDMLTAEHAMSAAANEALKSFQEEVMLGGD